MADTQLHGTGNLKALVTDLGGRYCVEMGIDVDAGPREVDRWFLAASLFGTRISAGIAVRTYRSLSEAGLATIDLVGRAPRAKVIRLLDAGGYARYDERTATRLRSLAAHVRDVFPDGVDSWGRSCQGSGEMVEVLDSLPGWGPVTVHAFLRELRGVWPQVDLDPDGRAACAAVHLGLVPDAHRLDLPTLLRVSDDVHVDPRDVEAALIRYDLGYRHRRRSERDSLTGCG